MFIADFGEFKGQELLNQQMANPPMALCTPPPLHSHTLGVHGDTAPARGRCNEQTSETGQTNLDYGL